MRLRLWMMAAMAVAVASPVRADYYAIDLNALGLSPVAVNSSRQFAGTREVAPGQGQAYRWDAATGFTDLGTLGGTTSAAAAISETGWVAGTSRTASGVQHAFLWQPGVGMTDLGTLGGTSTPTVSAVTAAGAVIGSAPTAGNAASHAFLYQPGVGMTDLGTFPAANPSLSHARGINAANTVVGGSFDATGNRRPFLWTAAGGMVDLGSINPTASDFSATATGAAYGINNSNLVVGQLSRGDGTDGAFVWQNGVFTDLGTFGGGSSLAYAVNDLGQVVGTAQNDAGEDRAFLWDATTGLVDINALLGPDVNINLTQALGITANGDILAASTTLDGTVVYLVTQNPDLDPPPTNDVPAPPAVLLLGLGLPLAGVLRRKWLA